MIKIKIDISAGTTAFQTLDLAIAYGGWLSRTSVKLDRDRDMEAFIERCEWILHRSEGDIWDWLERWEDEARGGEPQWSSWLDDYCAKLRASWTP